jgi:Protein of unknown function (DUF2808)
MSHRSVTPYFYRCRRAAIAVVAAAIALAPGRPQPVTAALVSTGAVAQASLAQAVVAFSAPPQLVAATTSRNLVSERNATYYLTLDLPAGANVGLQSVQVRLSEGHDSIFRFNPEDTLAFEGNRGSRGALLPLGEVTQSRPDKSISLRFETPVAPGRQVTIALRPERNPRFEGVYLFEVTAYPAGEQVESHFAGYARLQFYENDGDPLRQ